MTQNLREGNTVCKKKGMNIFIVITLIDKTDGKDPKDRKNYCMRALKTLAPDVPNIEDCTRPNTIYATYYNVKDF